MAMWSPDGFQEVLPNPDVNAIGLQVDGAWDIEVLEELPPVPGAAAPGGAPPPKWLKVRAFSPDGETIQEGFMLQEWLAEAPVERDAFARACLGAAQEMGTNAQLLLAFADMVSNVTNPPAKPSTACGPFQFTEEAWNAALAADPDLDLRPFDRFRPYLQPRVAASIMSRAEAANPNISAAQLSLILLFGQRQVDDVVSHPPDTAFDAALRAVSQNDPKGDASVSQKLSEDPAQLHKDPATGKVRTIDQVIAAIDTKLDDFLDKSEDALRSNVQDQGDSTPAELPVADQLSLGANEVYRDALLFAGNRTQFAPAALAALIDAEALKGKGGLWNPLSDARPHSSAFGLTQFLRDTWLAEAKRKGTFLNEQGNALRFIDGTTITNPVALLALRRDPRQSITAAAEYAVANLTQLAKQRITPKSMTDAKFALMSKGDDDEAVKAKLAYLAHHEGVGGAQAVIKGTLGEGPAERLLRANASRRADQLRAQAGSWRKAYVNWLLNYIGEHIVPAKFLVKAPAGGGGKTATGGGIAATEVDKKTAVTTPKPGAAVAGASDAVKTGGGAAIPTDVAAVPAGNPVDFAQLQVAADQCFWPVVTSVKRAMDISYRTTSNTFAGKQSREFLAMRQNGKRFHVGLDIFCQQGDIVLAIADGKIVNYYHFYEGTYALFIRHGDVVVNYGEVAPNAPREFNWQIGKDVKAGQKIARVGLLNMIHFETYRPGTVTNRRWMRDGSKAPSNLLNPTKVLLGLAARGTRITPPAPPPPRR